VDLVEDEVAFRECVYRGRHDAPSMGGLAAEARASLPGTVIGRLGEDLAAGRLAMQRIPRHRRLSE
jgi:hypothetical protein